ncbi:MAG: acyl-CoA reductase [Ginsengibacter sp.]
MNLSERIDLVTELGRYIKSDSPGWRVAKEKAGKKNSWFIEDFINLSANNIVDEFLQKDKLENWVHHYHLDDNIQPRNVGIVMPGNIPLVGFHDFLSVFISGHRQTLKLSTRDDILLKHLVAKLVELQPDTNEFITIADRLNNCDGYIATGSNNTSRYFHYYFGRKPSIIRQNRTSVAILQGDESEKDLELLADDVHTYFGLGCRNVTRLFVPGGYDFVPLLTAFRKYNYFSDHPKYKNNYDYYLAILIMNNLFYMTNESILLLENEELFSPISQVNYTFYTSSEQVKNHLDANNNIQWAEGQGYHAFGTSQHPDLFTYADGVDTMAFLLSL